MNRIVKILLSLVFSFGLCALLAFHFSSPKTGYVLIEELYSKFELKKEMEKKFNEAKNERQKILDSLDIQLRLMVNKLDKEKKKDKKEIENYNFKRQEFYEKQKSFAQDNKNLTDEYDKQILAQLNQYIKDFGKKYGYEFIFG